MNLVFSILDLGTQASVLSIPCPAVRFVQRFAEPHILQDKQPSVTNPDGVIRPESQLNMPSSTVPDSLLICMIFIR